MTVIQPMSRRRLLGLGSAAALAALAACAAEPGPKPPPNAKDPAGPSEHLDPADPSAVSYLDGQGDFSASMLRAAADDAKTNGVVSAFSIAQALAMIAQGAAGTTLEEIAAVLGAATAEELRGGANAQLTALGELTSAEVSIGNATFAAADLPVKDEYAAVLAAYFGVAAHQAPFVDDPAGAAAQINAWVASRTKDKIPELLEKDQITEDTRIVLVNAVYLLAAWRDQFKAERTEDGTFYTDDGEVSVPMMHDERQVEYAERDGTIIVRLPYEDDALAAYVVMPAEGELDGLVDTLDGSALGELLGGLEKAEAELWLPRFEARQRIELTDALKAQGVTVAFTDTADFSAMSEEPTMLSFVQHEAWIKVGEKGTEAAAATGGGQGATSLPLAGELELRIERPFLFVVREEVTGTDVFTAVIRDPSVPAD